MGLGNPQIEISEFTLFAGAPELVFKCLCFHAGSQGSVNRGPEFFRIPVCKIHLHIGLIIELPGLVTERRI